MGVDPVSVLCVCPDKIEQRRVGHGAVCEGKPDADKFCVGGSQANPVQAEQGQHDEQSDAFIAVDEGVIGDEAVPEPGALLLDRRVKLGVAESGGGAPERRFEQCHVADAGTAAGAFREQAVEGQHLFFCEESHLASFSNAA